MHHTRFILLASLLPVAVPARALSTPSPPVPAAPMRIVLGPGDPFLGGQDESITVFANRSPFRIAPTPYRGADHAPWEMNRAIRDTMTGADTEAFGNAYNLGSPLGSDERSNETGGQFLAPRHP